MKNHLAGPVGSRAEQARRAVVLQRDAADAAAQRRAQQPSDALCGGVRRQALGPDVADAVALGVGAADGRRVREVGAQAVGRAQARALAEQDQRHTGLQQRADFIGQRDPRLRGDDQRRASHAVAEGGTQRRQQRRSVALHGHGRQAVGQHQRQVHFTRRERLQSRRVGARQAAPEVGPAQVLIASRCAAAHGNAMPAVALQPSFERGHLQRHLHRVARCCMRGGEAQHFSRRHRNAAAAQANARRRVAAQIGPGVGRGWRDRQRHGSKRCIASASASASAGRAGAGSNSPAASVMSRRCNQASNSGARFKPSSRRTNSASWNEVLW